MADKRYYNREVLDIGDRNELDFWFDDFMSEINSLLWDYEHKDDSIFSKMTYEQVEKFADDLKESIASRFNEHMIGMIDGYDTDEDPGPTENPTDYYDRLEQLTFPE